jgi:serine/threonine protein kinase
VGLVNNYRKSKLQMISEIEGLKMQNTELTKERGKIVRNLEDFRLLIEGFASSTNHLMPEFTHFTYAQLKEVTNNFNDSLKIGEGGYGRVYKAFLGLKPVAIKILKCESHNGMREFNQEVISIRNLINSPYTLLPACTSQYVF